MLVYRNVQSLQFLIWFNFFYLNHSLSYLFQVFVFIDLMESFLFLSNVFILFYKLNQIVFYLFNVMCFTYLMQSFSLMQCNLLLRGCFGSSFHTCLAQLLGEWLWDWTKRFIKNCVLNTKPDDICIGLYFVF